MTAFCVRSLACLRLIMPSWECSSAFGSRTAKVEATGPKSPQRHRDAGSMLRGSFFTALVVYAVSGGLLPPVFAISCSDQETDLAISGSRCLLNSNGSVGGPGVHNELEIPGPAFWGPNGRRIYFNAFGVINISDHNAGFSSGSVLSEAELIVTPDGLFSDEMVEIGQGDRGADNDADQQILSSQSTNSSAAVTTTLGNNDLSALTVYSAPITFNVPGMSVNIGNQSVLTQTSGVAAINTLTGGTIRAGTVNVATKPLPNSNVEFAYGLLSEDEGSLIAIEGGAVVTDGNGDDNDAACDFVTPCGTSNSGLRAIRSGSIESSGDLLISTNGLGARGVYVSGQDNSPLSVVVPTVSLTDTTIETIGALSPGVQAGKSGAIGPSGGGPGILRSSGRLDITVHDPSSPALYIYGDGSSIDAAASGSHGTITGGEAFTILYDQGNTPEIKLRDTYIQTTSATQDLIFVGSGTSDGVLELYGGTAIASSGGWLLHVSDQDVATTYTAGVGGGTADLNLTALENAVLTGSINTAVTSTLDIALSSNAEWKLAGRNGNLSEVSSFSTLAVSDGALVDAAGEAGHNTSYTLLGDTVSLSDGGSIQLSDGKTGDVLTIQGDYISQNGQLSVDAALLGEETASSDVLLIDGDSSGNTLLTINKVSSQGEASEEGIKVVDVSGNSSGTFEIANPDYLLANTGSSTEASAANQSSDQGEPALISGAFSYSLNKVGNDWFLQSLASGGGSAWQPSVPVYEALALQLQNGFHLPGFDERGRSYWNERLRLGRVSSAGFSGGDGRNSDRKSGLWVGLQGAISTIDPKRSATGVNLEETRYGLEGGADVLVAEGRMGKLFAGLSAHADQINADTRSSFGNGRIETQTHGIGVSASFILDNGFYVDSQSRLYHTESELTSDILESGVDNIDGRAWLASLELGREFELGQSFAFRPEVQLTRQIVDLDPFTGSAGESVRLSDLDGWELRFGLSGGWDFPTPAYLELQAGGPKPVSRVYAGAGVHYRFNDEYELEISGTRLEGRARDMFGSLNAGIDSWVIDNRLRFYLDFAARNDLNSLGQNYSLGVSGGLNLKL